MKTQTDQNNQQPTNPTAQEDKLFIPEDHPLREQLKTLFANPDFQFVKAGLDHYEVPYLYEPKSNELVISSYYNNNTRYSIDCECLKSTVSYSYIVLTHILPGVHSALLNKANATVPEMSHAFAAYQRLNAASLAFDEADGIANVNDYTEIWSLFDDLVNLAFYTFRNDEVKISTVGKDGFTFCFEHHTSEPVPHTACIEFDIKSKNSIFRTLDELRAYYLWCHYSVTWNFETIQQIITDYHQIANQYVCHLTFTTATDPITLLSTYGNGSKVAFFSYEVKSNQATSKSLHALIKHIRGCSRKSDVEDADTLIERLIATTSHMAPGSTTSMQELFGTDKQ